MQPNVAPQETSSLTTINTNNESFPWSKPQIWTIASAEETAKYDAPSEGSFVNWGPS
jgi:hypothetical protein